MQLHILFRVHLSETVQNQNIVYGLVLCMVM